MKFSIPLLSLLSIFYIACNPKESSSNHSTNDSTMHVTDPHTFAKPDEAVVKHLDLDIAIDFDTKILSGKATLEIETKNSTQHVILDTRDLTVEKVTFENGEPAQFSIGEEVKFMGRALTVNCKPLCALFH